MSQEGCCAPCVGISPAAQHFITQSGTAAWEAIDLTHEGIASLRKETSDFAVPGCNAVQSEVLPVIEDSLLGGISVQWVSPNAVTDPQVILYLFGGGFISGCPEDDISITARLASFTGMRVCVPRYKLAPEHSFPAAHDDIITVYQTLIDSVPDGVILVGESAGGNLALGLVLGATSAGLPLPKAIALLSPWADLTHSGDSHITLASLDPTLSVEHFLQPASLAYAGGYATTSREISPLFADFPANFPPTIISSGTRDLLLSDSVRLAAKLRSAGCTVDLQVAEGLWHVYEWYPNLPESVVSLRGIAAFLSKHSRGATG